MLEGREKVWKEVEIVNVSAAECNSCDMAVGWFNILGDSSNYYIQNVWTRKVVSIAEGLIFD